MTHLFSAIFIGFIFATSGLIPSFRDYIAKLLVKGRFIIDNAAQGVYNL